MADFLVPPGTNELISQHLVTSAEIARRTGVGRAAVANWLHRHPKLAALAIPLSTDSPRSFVFWWPQVEECLAELGLPREEAKSNGWTSKARRPVRPRMACPVCSRDVQKRGDGMPRTHRPRSDQQGLTCECPGRHCRGGCNEGRA
ncbi:hypothetical protein ABZW11_26370 [Nonomuraea sp. NPDC004580]|uniref:hypothetical protein n=1 Tax=Nonomuraea sp. NPDC004580 TaxID=3154552 RepID=UPI0033B8BE2D